MCAVSKLFAAEQFQHKIRSRDPLHLSEALPAADPYCWCAVGHHQSRTCVHLCKFRIAVSLHNAMHANQTDVAFSSRLAFRLDACDCALHIEWLYWDAEDLHGPVSCFGFHMGYRLSREDKNDASRESAAASGIDRSDL